MTFRFNFSKALSPLQKAVVFDEYHFEQHTPLEHGVKQPGMAGNMKNQRLRAIALFPRNTFNCSLFKFPYWQAGQSVEYLPF